MNSLTCEIKGYIMPYRDLVRTGNHCPPGLQDILALILSNTSHEAFDQSVFGEREPPMVAGSRVRFVDPLPHRIWQRKGPRLLK